MAYILTFTTPGADVAIDEDPDFWMQSSATRLTPFLASDPFDDPVNMVVIDSVNHAFKLRRGVWRFTVTCEMLNASIANPAVVRWAFTDAVDDNTQTVYHLGRESTVTTVVPNTEYQQTAVFDVEAIDNSTDYTLRAVNRSVAGVVSLASTSIRLDKIH